MPHSPTSESAIQDSPTHDETVRMHPDGPSSRPSPTGSRARAVDVDDTRPVTRDWILGAPAEEATPDEAIPDAAPPGEAADEADSTQQIGTVPAEEPAVPSAVGDAPAEEQSGTDVSEPEQPEAAEAPVTEEQEHRETGTPAGPPPGDEPPTAGARGPWWRRRAVLAPAGAAAVLAAVYGVDLLVSSGSVPRHTVVSGVDIGGLSPTAASRTLQQELAPHIAADRTIRAGDVSGTLSPATAGIALDVAATVDAADDQPLNPWARLVTLFGDRAVAPVLATDETALAAQLDTFAEHVDRAPVDATISITGTNPQVVQPADGRTLDRDRSARAIAEALTSGRDTDRPIALPIKVARVHVSADEARRVLEKTVTPALSAPVTVSGQNGSPSAEIPVSAIAASLTFTPKEDGTLAVALDPTALQQALGDRLEVFGSPAKDARFEVSGDSIHVVPSVDGTGIAPAHLAEQLMPVLTSPAPRKVTAELGPVPAAVTTEQAKALGITEKVSSFTTNFTSPASGTNIRVVAAKVNGALVKPGETFSLNEYTGPRGTAQGYVEAAVISGGQLSKAVGGGISQFATTMFNAVFFAGLEDVHHKTHTFYISRYPAGREATVYDGLIDLAWKNDSPTGIYVQTQWTPGSITVTFWGTRHYDIESVSGERRNERQPAVQDKVDDGTCTPQSGVPGFDITVTRVFHDLQSGAVVRKQDFHTHYAPEAIIHCLSPAPAAPPA